MTTEQALKDLILWCDKGATVQFKRRKNGGYTCKFYLDESKFKIRAKTLPDLFAMAIKAVDDVN